ncbi:MAG: UDP-N-acetylglucosamine 2-epimerase (non-hydrolyzing) [Flavobacteriaceae bacterium]|nr:UDP-N-acetylglucosamine 2-epimerase (non-hydrolyzing) [Flavobacteriaceae bacterium]
MKKIVTVLGARPQFVKAAVLSRIINKYSEIEEVIIHTGQHFDANMSQIFFDEMEIPAPKYNLNIHGLQHGAMTAQMLSKIEEILLIEKPDALVVFGDTNSTLAGALAAKKLHLKVIHIEAGLRSFNMKMPEEINRIITDRLSDLLLCPTETAIGNLANEGFENFPSKVVKTGDIMKDAVSYYSKKSVEKSTIIKDLELESDNFVLATIHRQENTDSLENLNSIFKGLEKIAKETKVILPIHPRTRQILEKNQSNYNITLIDPVGYFDMLELLKHCKLVITDSGGLQKEAYFNQKYCVIAREETEWVELLENGLAQIVGSDSQNLVDAFDFFKQRTFNSATELYGNNVGEQIYAEIKSLLYF